MSQFISFARVISSAAGTGVAFFYKADVCVDVWSEVTYRFYVQIVDVLLFAAGDGVVKHRFE